MQNLAKGYLLPNKLFCEQDEWDWRAFADKVLYFCLSTYFLQLILQD